MHLSLSTAVKLTQKSIRIMWILAVDECFAVLITKIWVGILNWFSYWKEKCKYICVIFTSKDNTGNINCQNGDNSLDSNAKSTNYVTSSGTKEKATEEDSFEALLQKMKERLGSTNATNKNKNDTVKLWPCIINNILRPDVVSTNTVITYLCSVRSKLSLI